MEMIEIRFFEFVSPEPNSGCWLWTGYTLPGGYAQFWNGKRTVLAHRWAYEYFKSSIQPGLDLDHLCRVRCCVNPSHLEAVTNAENINRGLHGVLKTHCANGHHLSENNIYPATSRKRDCKICGRARRRRYNRKIAALRAREAMENDDG